MRRIQVIKYKFGYVGALNRCVFGNWYSYFKTEIFNRKLNDWPVNGYFTGESDGFLIGWEEAGIIAVEVQSRTTNIPLNSGYNMEALWTKWHKHCFTWKASGSFKVCALIKMLFFPLEVKNNTECYR